VILDAQLSSEPSIRGGYGRSQERFWIAIRVMLGGNKSHVFQNRSWLLLISIDLILRSSIFSVFSLSILTACRNAMWKARDQVAGVLAGRTLGLQVEGTIERLPDGKPGMIVPFCLRKST
jgi:hypothetical protein